MISMNQTVCGRAQTGPDRGRMPKMMTSRDDNNGLNPFWPLFFLLGLFGTGAIGVIHGALLWWQVYPRLSLSIFVGIAIFALGTVVLKYSRIKSRAMQISVGVFHGLVCLWCTYGMLFCLNGVGVAGFNPDEFCVNFRELPTAREILGLSVHSAYLVVCLFVVLILHPMFLCRFMNFERIS